MVEYTHLMLSGGAFYGYIYIGVYRFLKEHHLLKPIKYLYGTSIGAIASFLFGFDIDYSFVEAAFMTPDIYFKNYQFTHIDPNNIFNLISNYGICDTSKVRKPLEDILEKLYNIRDITFADYLKRTGKDLHINATCINTGLITDFCNEQFPNMSVLTAIEASICIPLIFKPIEYDNNLYMDGGASNNLPLHIVKCNPGYKLLAFCIKSINEKKTEVLKQNFFSYLLNICSSIINSTVFLELENSKNNDTIIVNTGDIPIPGLSIEFKNNNIILDFSKEDIEKAIVYGYERIYKHFIEKGYLSQI